jgi:hypothetical protein
MKKIHIKTGVLFAFVIFFTSCDKWIDTDLNTSKDNPISVPMEFLVPSIQVSMAYDLGGNDAVKPTNTWMQYFDGIDRQSLTVAQYLLTPSDVNNMWNSVYAGEMMDAQRLIKLSVEQKSPAYAGVGKICLGWCLGEMTNLFGAIPYSEAFQGSANLTPVFDKQSTIYNTVRTLLTEAIDDLGKTNSITLKGDLVYGNNSDQWIKAAHSLLARLELNTSKVKGDAAYTAALAHITEGFSSNADDFQVAFGSDEPNSNPIYQFMRDRGDIVMASTLMDNLNSVNDPRAAFYAKPGSADNLHGSIPGTQDGTAALPGSYNADAASPVVMMSYSELKFIEAEAKFQTDANGALAAYKVAVAASVLKVTGALNQEWLDANINIETSSSLTLEKIMNQKYLALYSQNQAYTDFRRTGFPTFLVRPLGALRDAPPRRFPYPQEEVTYNSANIPAGGDLNGSMWIDGGEDVGNK